MYDSVRQLRFLDVLQSVKTYQVLRPNIFNYHLDSGMISSFGCNDYDDGGVDVLGVVGLNLMRESHRLAAIDFRLFLVVLTISKRSSLRRPLTSSWPTRGQKKERRGEILFCALYRPRIGKYSSSTMKQVD